MNILFFGPNGSGKGTQGSILKGKYNTAHIESGAIFRDNIKGGTELGAQAKAYIDKGDLVPDEITIPMILDRLQQDDCKDGWLLDGFPRNKNQAIKLDEALKAAGMKLDIVIEILLDRARAGQLADTLLAGLPKDAFSGKDFKYEKTKEGFILHCRDKDLGKNELYQYDFKLSK